MVKVQTIDVLIGTFDRFPKYGKGGPGAVITKMLSVLCNEISYRELSKSFKINFILNDKFLFLNDACKLIEMTPKTKNQIDSKMSIYSIIYKKIISKKFLKNAIEQNILIKNLFSLFFLYHFFRLYNKLLKRIIHNKNPIRLVIKEANIIHFHDPFSFFFIVKKFEKEIIQKKLILSIHSPGSAAIEYLRMHKIDLFNTILEKIIKKIELYSIKKADYLILPSYSNKKIIESDLKIKIPDEKIFVIYNGVDPLKRYNKKLARQRIGINKDKFVMCFVGRLIEDKGIDILLKSLELIDAEIARKLFLIVIGKGKLRNYVIKELKRLKESKKIDYLYAEFVEELDCYLSASDLLIIPSRRSAFDLIVLEAFSIGLPTLTTYAGGNKEAILKIGEKEAKLLLVNPNPVELSARIKYIYNNKNLLKKIEIKEIEIYKRFFTTEKMTENYLRFYKNIMKLSRSLT